MGTLPERAVPHRTAGPGASSPRRAAARKLGTSPDVCMVPTASIFQKCGTGGRGACCDPSDSRGLRQEDHRSKTSLSHSVRLSSRAPAQYPRPWSVLSADPVRAPEAQSCKDPAGDLVPASSNMVTQAGELCAWGGLRPLAVLPGPEGALPRPLGPPSRHVSTSLGSTLTTPRNQQAPDFSLKRSGPSPKKSPRACVGKSSCPEPLAHLHSAGRDGVARDL